MARKGRKDRGYFSRKNTAGETVWYVRVGIAGGKEKQFGSFKTKTAARQFYEKCKTEQAAGRFNPERYQHGGYELVQETLDRHMKTTIVKNRWAEAKYARWWGERLAGKRLNAITPAALDEAMRELGGQGLSPQTVVHYMKFLRHVLNVAVRDGRLERNPFVQVKLPKVGTGRTRFLSPEEEGTLLEALGPIHGPWARLAILTGLRREEQFGLRWEHVDLERGLLTLPQTKAGIVQYVHLNEEARAILRGLDSWQRSVWVFPSGNPATHLDPRHFYSRTYQPAVKQAGLAGLTWHDLRHTFASRLAMSGQTEGTIAALLRHSSTALVRRYAHLSPGHLREAIELVAGFGKGDVWAKLAGPGQEPVESLPNRDRTVMEKGTGVAAAPEVLEKIGAPDRI